MGLEKNFFYSIPSQALDVSSRFSIEEFPGRNWDLAA
jgi:hypothetical protein